MEQGCVSPLVPAETLRFYLSYALESLTILFEERATHWKVESHWLTGFIYLLKLAVYRYCSRFWGYSSKTNRQTPPKIVLAVACRIDLEKGANMEAGRSVSRLWQ